MVKKMLEGLFIGACMIGAYFFMSYKDTQKELKNPKWLKDNARWIEDVTEEYEVYEHFTKYVLVSKKNNSTCIELKNYKEGQLNVQFLQN